MNTITQEQLFTLFERHQSVWQSANQSLPIEEYDLHWRSPCQVGEAQAGKIHWKAIKREAPVSLNNIEQALDITLHPSIVDFYCSAFSACIPCLFEDHPIDLIQIWNDQDFQQLQENIIAHFMMQKRLKQPASMFIASCSDEMQIVSVINETGQVQLENLGKGQAAVLSDNLADFLSALQPVTSA